MIQFIEQVTVVLSIALLHRYILRFCGADGYKRQFAIGVLFGVMCIFVMSVPVMPVEGVIFDARSLVLGLSGIFSGVIGAIATATIAIVYRIFISGEGYLLGISFILICALSSLLYSRLIHLKKLKVSFTHLLVYGFLLHTAELCLITLLPNDMSSSVLSSVIVPFYLILVPGIILLGLLLRDNERTVQLASDLAKKTRETLDAQQKSDALLYNLKQKQNLIDDHAIYSETDIKGNITFVNRLFCEISGYSEAELIGQNHRILNSREHPRSLFSDLWRTIRSGRTWRGDLKNHRKDGEAYWVKSTISPRLDINGNIIGYASIRTDVTEDIKRESEATEAKNEALEANAAKSRFIATMSHELRTPLNAIIGFSDIIKMEAFGSIGNEKYKEYIEDINASGNHLKQMVDDILDLTRLDLKSFEFKSESWDVTSATREVVSRFQHLAEGSGIKFKFSASEDFPKSLYTDRKVLIHILNNLISNSVKASRKNGEISVRWESRENHFALIVSDTGCGMSPETLEQLGQPFVSHKGEYLARSNDEGIGLGFYITKSMVEARGGEVKVKSAINEGTTVELIYPKEVFATQPAKAIN
ncbi:ATP-binding protein [Sneathiella chinensis]|uniref:histidine kinase n=1 Tax=Sneathiella chinensis TaxID=349750 RepID=A0ABQ5TZ23_9PROT|nr:ATP-binding protein [Sneathiella chinensis]GLQ05122.1 PAS domain-containing sensor histidine kinase [Sneathiella chinensis]